MIKSFFGANMFSVASFLITLRETIEAALVISIILTYVIKVKQNRLKRDIWIGTALGIVISIGFGILFSFVLGSFEDYENIIEGFSMILAAILMTWMIIWMSETGRDYQKNLESKIDVTIRNEQRLGLIALAFISVLREGIETVIFLTGVESVDETPMDILWSGLIGIFVALIFALILFLSSKKINLKLFFSVTGIFLILFAAGMLSHGFHELQDIGWFSNENNFLQTIVWDTSSLLNDKTSELGKFLRTLFGYQDQPTWLEIISYFGYYLLMGVLFLLVKIMKRNKQNKDKITMLKTESTQ
ncbi:MAG: FTR1 family protein [Candidatus Heimdallarchaeota archaeon]|nr:FTR1 family protein [Candidatus Heimdallarchaeota archaeon]MCK4254065.1 FTR1 family protein [Candidatus Heimdallarchaeota archaeon]